MWVSTWSSIRCCGTRLGNLVDTIIPLWNKNCSGNAKVHTDFFGADKETQSHLHWQFLGIWQGLWRLSWKHCTSTPHRSETNGIVEKAVRRVKEGTCAVPLQSGADLMECYCYPRKIQDLLFDGKTPYEWRFGEPFDGPDIPFGAMVEYQPITARTCRDCISLVQKSCQENSLDVLCAEGIWKGDTNVAIETDGRHLNSTKKTQCQGSVDVNKKWKLRVPSRRWNSQNFWRRSRSENIRLYLEHTRPRRTTRYSSRKIRSVIFTHDNKTHHGMMVEPKVIFGLSQKILFTVITWNPESNCTWRLKNHFLFHWNTLTIPEQPTRLQMRCRRKTFKITRQKWKKRNSDRLQEIQCVEWETTWWMYMVRGETDEETNDFKTRQCGGQIWGSICLMHRQTETKMDNKSAKKF